MEIIISLINPVRIQMKQMNLSQKIMACQNLQRAQRTLVRILLPGKK